MNKNISRVLLFLLIMLAMIYSLQYGIDYCYNKRVHQKFTKIFKHQADANIMLFGSSVMYHQFDPRVIQAGTGKTAYNMGWDGVFFVQYNSLIKEYLSYEKQCRYIVIACDFDNLGKNDLITRPDLFFAYLNNQHVYKSLHEIEPDKMFNARYLPGYKFTILSKSFYNDIISPAPDQPGLYGFDPITTPWDQAIGDKLKDGRYEEQIFAELRSTIAEINSKGIKVVLVMTPMYEQGYKLLSNPDWIKDKYKSLVNKDVYFMDYTTDSICIIKEYFHDYAHLNATGAAKFSQIFTKDLLHILHE